MQSSRNFQVSYSRNLFKFPTLTDTHAPSRRAYHSPTVDGYYSKRGRVSRGKAMSVFGRNANQRAMIIARIRRLRMFDLRAHFVSPSPFSEIRRKAESIREDPGLKILWRIREGPKRAARRTVYDSV